MLTNVVSTARGVVTVLIGERILTSITLDVGAVFYDIRV